MSLDSQSDPDLEAALRTLLLPFDGATLPSLSGRRVLLANARTVAGALPTQAREWRLQQDFRPHAEALARAGFASTPELPEGEFDVLLLLAPRQRQHCRAQLARLLGLRAPAGLLAACAGNDHGARSLQRDLQALAGPVQALSKHHCRVCWTQPGAIVDAGLRAEWLAADAPTPIAGGRFLSRPGVFAWDRVDAASELLAARLPAGLAGRGADLGCGYGFLAAEVLARNPGVAALDLYEADARALALARENLAGLADAELCFHWHDVAGGLPRSGYDFIVSNPPFHEGRADRPELGRAFIAAAAAALRPGGRFFLVANRHLPYEATLAQGFARLRTLADERGFKVIEAVRG